MLLEMLWRLPQVMDLHIYTFSEIDNSFVLVTDKRYHLCGLIARIVFYLFERDIKTLDLNFEKAVFRILYS